MLNPGDGEIVRTEGDDGYVVRLGDASDLERVHELFQAVFAERAPEVWQWRYGGAPKGWFSVVLEKDGRLVGHRVSALYDATVDNEPVLVGAGGDAMVHPDHRGNHGLRRMRSLTTRHAHFDLRVSFPVDKVVWRWQRKGDPRVGVLAQWVRWLRPSGVRASSPTSGRVVAAATVIGSRVIVGLGRLRGRHLRVEQVKDLDTGFDRLADESAGFARAVRRRDAAYLRHRWWDRPDGPRTILAARDRRGRLAGWVVISDDEKTSSDLGVKVGRVVDLLARTSSATTVLLAAATRQLDRSGAGLVLFDYQDHRPWARRACLAAGFLDRGTGANVAALQNDVSTVAPPVVVADWYLTFGDSDLC